MQSKTLSLTPSQTTTPNPDSLGDFLSVLSTSQTETLKTSELDKKIPFEEKFQLDNMREFSVLFFADSLKRFIESLDYFVIAYDTCYNLSKYTNPLSTIQVGVLVLIFIIWYEVVIGLVLIVLGLFSIYNKFHRRVYTPPAICYSRNMQFL